MNPLFDCILPWWGARYTNQGAGAEAPTQGHGLGQRGRGGEGDQGQDVASEDDGHVCEALSRRTGLIPH